MDVFYSTPAWIVILLVTAGFVALACGGHIAVRRSFPPSDFIRHNEVAGFIIAVVGVLYAVLLAFLTVIVWEHFSAAEDRAAQEVDAATDMWRFAEYLDTSDNRRITNDLKAYTSAIVTDEWPAMRHGGSSPEAQSRILQLLSDIVRTKVGRPAQVSLQNRLLDRFQIMADLRRRRINDNQSGIPSVLWIALFVGAAVVIGFIYLFGLENFRVQLLMTAATAMIIGLSFSVVIALDFPFRGDISISPERWITLHHAMVLET